MQRENDGVGRIQTCPTLGRTFYEKGEHRDVSEYVKEWPTPELCLYAFARCIWWELFYVIAGSGKVSDLQSNYFAIVVPDLKLGDGPLSPWGRCQVNMNNTETQDTKTLESYGFTGHVSTRWIALSMHVFQEFVDNSSNSHLFCDDALDISSADPNPAPHRLFTAQGKIE
jgi:hypothetical protein